MAKPESNLDALMQDPKAASLLKNKDLLKNLVQSPDTQRLMQLLSQDGSDGLKRAAASAAKGDAGALMGIVNQVMQSKEGAGLIERSAAEGDARVSLVRLSAEGQRRFAEASSAIERTYCEMLSGFSDDECRLILGGARRMGQNLTGGAEEQTDAHRND